MSEQLNPIEPPVPMVPPQRVARAGSSAQPPVANGAEHSSVIRISDWVDLSKDLAKLEERLEHLVTSDEVAELKTELVQMKEKMEHLVGKEDLADIKAEIAKIKSELAQMTIRIDHLPTKDEVFAEMKFQRGETDAKFKAHGERMDKLEERMNQLMLAIERVQTMLWRVALGVVVAVVGVMLTIAGQVIAIVLQ